MKHVKYLLTALTIVGIPAAAHAQVFLTNFRTTASDIDSSVVERLFLDPGFTTLAPLGSRLWVVVDRNSDGLPSYTGPFTPEQVLGADDEIVYQDVVDGTILGNQPGKYLRDAITVTNPSNDVDERPLYAFLWGNGTPTSEDTIVAGNSFGVFNMGVNPIPPVGNAEWYISGNINGNEFTAAPPIPEPTSVLFASLGLAAFALIRRRFGRKAAA
ncbi:MAG: PEP-CTERM sorting domain-containing protein [Verrucomicrobiales bacterium]|nr:PEP-CTERM sorting domain-containing protein [Verrucomicrobiales bacterium]